MSIRRHGTSREGELAIAAVLRSNDLTHTHTHTHIPNIQTHTCTNLWLVTSRPLSCEFVARYNTSNGVVSAKRGSSAHPVLLSANHRHETLDLSAHAPRQRPPPQRRPAPARRHVACEKHGRYQTNRRLTRVVQERECEANITSDENAVQISRFFEAEVERACLCLSERTIVLTRATTKRMMYALRPIVTSVDARPRVRNMYEMRNIQGDHLPQLGCDDVTETTAATTTMTTATTTTTTTMTTITTTLSPPCDGTKMPDVTEQVIRLLQNTSPDYNTLATRQEEILKQLAELKEQIFKLCKFLKRSSQETMRNKIMNEVCQTMAAENCESQAPVEVNLVLNVNPWKPPYSIYALQKFWKDTNIIITSYTHSSIVGRVPIDFLNNTHPDANNIINLTIIFKAVDDLQVITSLLKYPLIGEVNFLRYLSRLINAHNYEKKDFASVCITDNILDLCCRVRYQISRDKIDELMSMLYQELEQTRWNGRDEPSIADIAAWSTIKQFSSNKRLPHFIQRWNEICEKSFMAPIR